MTAPDDRPASGTAEVDAADLVRRTDANAHVMVLRGVVVRAIGLVAGVLVLALVAPLEYGIFAVVRGIIGIVEGLVDHAMGFGLLRRHEEPTRAEYAGLAGAQLAILAVVLGVACAWPHAALGFGAIAPRWTPWMLATLAALLVIPWGSGARVRIERQLDYSRLAILEVLMVLGHSLIMLAAAVLGVFAYGVFVAQIVVTLGTAALVHRWSPGPAPMVRVSSVVSSLRTGAGFSSVFVVETLREHLTPIVIARMFGLASAGAWAFAGRAGLFVQFGFESFAQVAMPAAARLSHDRAGLRRLAESSLAGAATLALPLAGLLYVGLPAVVALWPAWRPAIPLVQVHVLFLALAGVAGAALLPVAIAVRGWPVALGASAIHAVALWTALLGLWAAGRSDLALVVAPVQTVVIAGTVLMTDRGLRPSLATPELARVGLALGAGLVVHSALTLLDVSPLACALVAGAAILGGVRPSKYVGALRARLVGS